MCFCEAVFSLSLSLSLSSVACLKLHALVSSRVQEREKRERERDWRRFFVLLPQVTEEVEKKTRFFFFLSFLSRAKCNSFYLSSAASAAAMASLMAVHMLMGRSVSGEASDSEEEESRGSTAAAEEEEKGEERERRRRRRVDGARLSIIDIIILSPCSLCCVSLVDVCSSFAHEGSEFDREMPQPQREACREQRKDRAEASKKSGEHGAMVLCENEERVFLLLSRLSLSPQNFSKERKKRKDKKKLGNRESSSPFISSSFCPPPIFSIPHISLSLYQRTHT